MGSGEELQGSMQDRLSFRPQLLWLSDRLGNRLQTRQENLLAKFSTL